VSKHKIVEYVYQFSGI